MEIRLAITCTASEVENKLDLKISPNETTKYFQEPFYNLAPSSFLPVVTNLQKDKIRFLKWGLIPSWSNSSKNTKGLSSINVASFSDKPVLQKALKNKRCIVLASGFYLYKESPAGKIPYYVQLKSKSLFAIAGLWESWEEEENTVNTCCIISRKTSATLAFFTCEMPTVIKWEEKIKWLDTEKDDILSEKHLVSEAEFEYYPVSRKIIKSLENDARFIQSVSYLVAEQTKLF